MRAMIGTLSEEDQQASHGFTTVVVTEDGKAALFYNRYPSALEMLSRYEQVTDGDSDS